MLSPQAELSIAEPQVRCSSCGDEFIALYAAVYMPLKAVALVSMHQNQEPHGKEDGVSPLHIDLDRLRLQHQEVLERLSKQDDMLVRLLERPVVSLHRSRTGLSDRSRGSKLSREALRPAPSYPMNMISEESKEMSSEPSQTDSTRHNLFVSYTEADLEHKHQALHVGSRSERRRFASIRSSTAFQGSRSKIWKDMVQHPAFEVVFGIVVITNAVFIGVDVQQSLGAVEVPMEFQILQPFALQFDGTSFGVDRDFLPIPHSH